jgi:hypothetical protein
VEDSPVVTGGRYAREMMDGAIILLVVGAVALSTWVRVVKVKKGSRAFDEAADSLGFTVKDGKIHGECDGFRVAVRRERPGGSREVTFLAVGSHGRRQGVIPLDVRISTDLFPGKEKSGDLEFDRRIRVTGPEAVRTALMTAEARGIIDVKLPREETYTVQEGQVLLTVHDLPSGTDLADRVDEACRLARLLAEAAVDIPARLAQNVAEDPLLTVRVRNLDVLCDHFPDSLAAGRAMVRFLDLPQVRFRLLLSIGEKGIERLSSTLSEGGSMESRSIRCLRLLADGSGKDEVVNSIVRALGRLNYRSRFEAMEALCRRGAGLDEGDAIAALQSDEPDVWRVAVKVLERVGTVSAVGPLRSLLQERSLPFGLAGRVKDAIERIQERIPGADRGQLHLAGTVLESGGVSLAEEGGRISLPAETEEEEGEDAG